MLFSGSDDVVRLNVDCLEFGLLDFLTVWNLFLEFVGLVNQTPAQNTRLPVEEICSLKPIG